MSFLRTPYKYEQLRLIKNDWLSLLAKSLSNKEKLGNALGNTNNECVCVCVRERETLVTVSVIQKER